MSDEAQVPRKKIRRRIVTRNQKQASELGQHGPETNPREEIPQVLGELLIDPANNIYASELFLVILRFIAAGGLLTITQHYATVPPSTGVTLVKFLARYRNREDYRSWPQDHLRKSGDPAAMLAVGTELLKMISDLGYHIDEDVAWYRHQPEPELDKHAPNRWNIAEEEARIKTNTWLREHPGSSVLPPGLGISAQRDPYADRRKSRDIQLHDEAEMAIKELAKFGEIRVRPALNAHANTASPRDAIYNTLCWFDDLAMEIKKQQMVGWRPNHFGTHQTRIVGQADWNEAQRLLSSGVIDNPVTGPVNTGPAYPVSKEEVELDYNITQMLIDQGMFSVSQLANHRSFINITLPKEEDPT